MAARNGMHWSRVIKTQVRRKFKAGYSVSEVCASFYKMVGSLATPEDKMRSEIIQLKMELSRLRRLGLDKQKERK